MRHIPPIRLVGPLLAAAAKSLLLAAAVALRSCGEPREVMFSVPSPDGSLIAHAARSTGGGATTGFEYEVVVVRAYKVSGLDDGGDRVWRSYRMPPVAIEWQSDEAVLVTVEEDERYQDMVRIGEALGVVGRTATKNGL